MHSHAFLVIYYLIFVTMVLIIIIYSIEYNYKYIHVYGNGTVLTNEGYIPCTMILFIPFPYNYMFTGLYDTPLSCGLTALLPLHNCGLHIDVAHIF